MLRRSANGTGIGDEHSAVNKSQFCKTERHLNASSLRLGPEGFECHINANFNPNEPRDKDGKWTTGGSSSKSIKKEKIEKWKDAVKKDRKVRDTKYASDTADRWKKEGRTQSPQQDLKDALSPISGASAAEALEHPPSRYKITMDKKTQKDYDNTFKPYIAIKNDGIGIPIGMKELARKEAIKSIRNDTEYFKTHDYKVVIIEFGEKADVEYNAIIIVTKKDGTSSVAEGSTWPDNFEVQPGIADGVYQSKFGNRAHKKRDPAMILNNKGRINTYNDLPNPYNKGESYADAIELHNGWQHMRGSQSCLTIAPKFQKNFWKQFKEGDKGNIYIKRISKSSNKVRKNSLWDITAEYILKKRKQKTK